MGFPYLTNIEQQARQESRVISYDAEKRRIFLSGCNYALETLARSIFPDHYDSMMDKKSLEYIEKLRLDDVRKALSILLERKLIK